VAKCDLVPLTSSRIAVVVKAQGAFLTLTSPIGAVSHTDEPYTYGIEDSSVYFGLWASGKTLAICAWNSHNTSTPTPYFQVVGDPFVRR
jgi:hypothetical protein